jgi:hypothetical protein
MRTSREWIEKTVAELDDPVALEVPRAARTARATRDEPAKFELTLTPQELAALDEVCLADDLSPRQALIQIVRARLLDQPQFGRADRARLRACLELLRALEQHVGRAARPAAALRPSVAVANASLRELIELGVYLRRVGRAIGESMLGNLQYWRGEPRPASDEPVELAAHTADPEALGSTESGRARRPPLRA